MPEITWFGWLHTVIAIIGILAGAVTLSRHKVICWEHGPGKVYLLCTLIAAVTALMIYRHDGFGPAHALAVLTLLALGAGSVVHRLPIFAGSADYLQAFCFTGTLLCHMIPAITDGLLRLPVGDPVLTRHDDPLLLKFYGLFVLLFLVGYTCQFLWLRRRHEN